MATCRVITLEKDLRATNYLLNAISNRQLEYVLTCSTAFEIIEKFDSMYLIESTALQIVCQSRLEKLKLNLSNTVEFFDEFEKGINNLKQAGACVFEEEKLNYMLRALPSELSYIGDLMDVIPKEERTVEFLKSKIEIKREQEHSSEKILESEHFSAFKVKSDEKQFRGVCHILQKEGSPDGKLLVPRKQKCGKK